jgi:hypothetical protein
MGEMSFPNRGLIRFSIILEKILYEALQSEIGLNLSKEPRFPSLGIKARKVELVLPPTLNFWWNYLIILNKSVLIISQHVL